MVILTSQRISTAEQTLQPQRIELASYIARLPGAPHVVEEFSDVISGAKAKRPGLDFLLARCAVLPRPDVVLVVKLDRLGRSVINVVGLVQKLKAAGVSVICTSQGIDTRDSNPCGRLMLTIMAACAELERDMIIERTKAGLVAAVARGKVLGQPSKTLVPGVERVPIIERWIAGGKVGGFRALAVALRCSPMTARKLYRELPVASAVEVESW